MTALLARVVDVETTGLPEEDARICEVGFIDVDLGEPTFPVIAMSKWSSLINPGEKMRPEISAVHHLTDSDVQGAPGILYAVEFLDEGMGLDDVYVAHQAKFEQHFIPGRPQRWVDTYKCALRAWPDAPGHNVQVLRYWLAAQGLINIDSDLAMPPHRALPDAYATAHIFSALMRIGRPLERLVELSGAPGFLPKVTFGEHYGKKFSEVPRSYLEWMCRTMTKPEDEDKFYTANYWLRKAETA